jgi:hypothetical protein
MIPVEQLARLAERYDRYNNALDPFSEDCRKAKAQFDALAEDLHTARAVDVKFEDFRYELVKQCRDYLRKNRPA